MNPEDEPLLSLLQERYGDRWRIRRTAHLWIATARDTDTHKAPTIVEPDVEEFVRQLETPPDRVGRSLLACGWFRSQADQIGDDGAYRFDGPPMA